VENKIIFLNIEFNNAAHVVYGQIKINFGFRILAQFYGNKNNDNIKKICLNMINNILE